MAPRLRPGLLRLLAALLATASAAGAAAAERQADAGSFSLRYDDVAWTREPAAPPSLLVLRCSAPSCPPHAVVTFVGDERTLAQPGVAAFGPGAATGAAVDLRIQNLTPGSRVLARRPVEPVAYGGMTGYRGLYDVEDRALARTAAAIALLRLEHGTLEVRLKADRLAPADLPLFDRLLEGLTPKD